MIDLEQLSEMHTPGPWSVVEGCEVVAGPFDERAAGSWLIAVVSLWPHNLGPRLETSPNARLIAAAPDLLADVKALRARVVGLETTLRAVRHCTSCHCETPMTCCASDEIDAALAAKEPG